MANRSRSLASARSKGSWKPGTVIATLVASLLTTGGAAGAQQTMTPTPNPGTSTVAPTSEVTPSQSREAQTTTPAQDAPPEPSQSESPVQTSAAEETESSVSVAPSGTMPARPKSDGPNGNAEVRVPRKQKHGAQALALPGCADFWNPAMGSWFMVCGRILDKYNEFGGPNGSLGLPTSNELTNPDGVGKRTSFTNDASIYWSPESDAHQIGG